MNETLMLDAFQHYEENPVDFCQEVIGVELDQWQIDALNNLQKYHFLTIRSGSGIGKTCLLSLITLWFISTKPFCKIPTTAPTQHQLYDLLWSEHHKWISRSPFLQELLVWTQTRIGVKGHEPEWYAVARTAQASPSGEVAEGLQGFHCCSCDTEALTDSGWKLLSDVDIKKDKLLTKDPETDEAFYEQPFAMFKDFYQGKMWHSLHQNLDFLVTPNHKIPYRSATRDGFSELKIEEIQKIAYSRWCIEDMFTWTGHDFDTFEIPEYRSPGNFRPATDVDAETWFKFLAAYLSDGHTRKDNLKVMIGQKEDASVLIILYLIEKLGFTYSLTKPRSDIYMISISSVQLGTHLKTFGSLATNKRLPSYLKAASPRLIDIFLDAYTMYDGAVNKNGARVFYTSSKELADDLQELIYKLGRKGSVLKYEVKDSVIKGKLVTNCADRYIITEYVRTSSVSFDPQVNLEIIDYEGDVYCPTMPTHHLFFMRRNGFCMWSGNSEDNLLFIVDEASGVPDAVFPAVEGSLTGPNAYCILAGNPTRTDGYFADIFNKPQLGRLYKKMHVSCFDSPRVEARYIEMMKERYGEEHPIYLIKVLGEFASGSINTLIPVSYIEAMQQNSKERVMSPTVPARIGLDVGRSNASSVLTVRQGFNVLEMVERHKAGRVTDTHEICQWTIEYINAYNPEYVLIDAIGIGAGVYDGLKIIYGDMIIPVIGGQKSSKPERYLNLRAEGYWDLRELIPKLWCKDWPQRLITEMGDLRQKTTVSRNVIQIESKQDMIKRSLRSPDHLDSLMYAFLSPEACLAERVMSPFLFASGFAAINADLVKEDTGSLWTFFSKNTPVNRWKGLNEQN